MTPGTSQTQATQAINTFQTTRQQPHVNGRRTWELLRSGAIVAGETVRLVFRPNSEVTKDMESK
jgi:hypothetical protein